MLCRSASSVFFFFNDTATTEIYTLSLHDALPIYQRLFGWAAGEVGHGREDAHRDHRRAGGAGRSEEHTSELQSRLHLVCRLLLEKKKQLITDRDLALYPPITVYLHYIIITSHHVA